MATLVALAAKPKRIKRLFREVEINEQGVWKVTMNKNGATEEIVMDDFLPVTGYNSEERKWESKCVANPVDRKLWPLILEKAWAKLHGSYERIIWGRAESCMKDLTGAPGNSIATSTRNLLGKMQDYFSKGYIMTCSRNVDGEEKGVELPNGLVNDHVYAVLAIKELSDPAIVLV